MNTTIKFQFDPRVKDGFFIADYFKKTTTILEKYKPEQIVTMQFFQRKENTILCGIEESLGLLKFASKSFENLEIWSLNDGDLVQPLEPVLKIKGRYQDFGWLEGMIDGILARNSSVATNSRQIVEAANGKILLNMLDRADSFWTLPSDGYASYIGGFRRFVSEAAVEYINDETVAKPSGTMPHALIQSFDGDILEATKAFATTFPNVNLVSLVDYNNDCVNDALKVANYFNKKLWAVRLDTAGNLIDKTVQKCKESYRGYSLNGVSIPLVKEVRKALDAAGHQHVKIIVSSGFNAEKIAYFESENAAVDIYGMGDSLAKVTIGFTGDAVLINGKKESKFGRENKESKRLIKR
ncbi:nicotinate phosphoribosyltransferase [Mesoplasma syrphidae]|uniref:nicotinate phosphoribosyltransferase n=1 Tax=Mesoplasma syrphidae TaxID=225999 RepID=A0A2K9CCJ4_9MOLU|nr:nicotinate phosphoribosyltransferase [Mesoplasma syrphidae]AUF83364.1 nicotinate phosphoribosyltransferase [Mesoplasma syrphidae]